MADAPRGAERHLQLDRRLVQPPPAALRAQLSLARRLRERNSLGRRCESRRFAARVPLREDQGEGCLTAAPTCPPNRVRSRETNDLYVPCAASTRLAGGGGSFGAAGAG